MDLTTNYEHRYYGNSIKRYCDMYKIISDRVSKEQKGLDVGIFPGFFTFTLKDLGYNIQGMDLHPENLNEEIKKTIKVTKADIEAGNLPFKDNTFDYVLLLAVIEHLRINPLQTLREINRILKPGGTFFVQTPNLLKWSTRVKMFLGFGLPDSPYKVFNMLDTQGYLGHLRLYSMLELIEVLEKTGFKVQEKQYFSVCPRSSFLIKLLNKVLGVVPSLRSQLCVVCKKI